MTHLAADLIHAVIHQHTHTPVPTGMLRSCRNRVTGRTRWTFAAAGRRPVWQHKSVIEVGRLNVGGVA